MDAEFSKWLATLGVGGILAAIFYYQARKDAQNFQERLMALHEIERGRTEMLVGIVKENTFSTTINTEVLRSLHKRLDADEVDRVELRAGK